MIADVEAGKSLNVKRLATLLALDVVKSDEDFVELMTKTMGPIGQLARYDRLKRIKFDENGIAEAEFYPPGHVEESVS